MISAITQAFTLPTSQKTAKPRTRSKLRRETDKRGILLLMIYILNQPNIYYETTIGRVFAYEVMRRCRSSTGSFSRRLLLNLVRDVQVPCA